MNIIGVVIGLLIAVFPYSDGLLATPQTELGDVVQYRDGDVILAVFIPISNRDSNGKCDRPFRFIHMVEQVNMMIEQINADDNILPGVTLGTIMINTCLDEQHTLKKLLLDVVPTYVLGLNCTRDVCPPKKRILAGVIGAAKSSVSTDMAKVLQIFDIPQVSYWSTNPALSDKNDYKYFFRTVPPDNYQTLAMVKFITEREWNYVSIVYQDDAYGAEAYKALAAELKRMEICVAILQPMRSSPKESELSEISRKLLEKENSKAVVVIAGFTVMERLLRVASKQDKKNELIWIASDGWTSALPTNPVDNSYLDSLHGTVGFYLKFPPVDEVVERIRKLTIKDYIGENFTLNPWWTEYVQEVKNCTLEKGAVGRRKCDENESVPDFTGIKNGIGDALNVYIHALNSYHKETCGNSSGLCPEMEEGAGTNKLACELYDYLKNVTFPIDENRNFSFDDNQDGPPVYEIVAFDKNKATPGNLLKGWTEIGTFNNATGIHLTSPLPEKVNLTVSVCTEPCKPGQAKILIQHSCCWHCQTCTHRQYVFGNSCEPCSDHEMPNENQTGCVPIPIRKLEYSSTPSICIIVLGVFGLLCTLFVTALYTKHRDTAIVRASGRELCFFVLFGVFITLLNCFSITAPPSAVSCALTRVILAMGPTCMYAGLLMKTFRVVFIFRSKGILSKRTKAYLEPVPLIFLTLCVVSIQLVVLVIWMAIHVPNCKVYYYDDKNDAFLSCGLLLTREMFVGLAYPFLIIVVCTILSTINRNVPTGFRETLYVGFTMYTTCVTWIAFQALFFTATDDKPRQLTTLSLALSISALTVLFCLFGPRCYTILRHPELNTSETVMSQRGSNHPTPPNKPPTPSLYGIENAACSTTGHA